jgi:hypothetical protein
VSVDVQSFYHPNDETANPPILPPFFLYSINRTTQVKLLEVILHSTLTYSHHISKPMCKADHTLKQLYHTLNKTSAININLTLTFYKSLIRSTLTHEAPKRGQAAKTHFKKF